MQACAVCSTLGAVSGDPDKGNGKLRLVKNLAFVSFSKFTTAIRLPSISMIHAPLRCSTSLIINTRGSGHCQHLLIMFQLNQTDKLYAMFGWLEKYKQERIWMNYGMHLVIMANIHCFCNGVEEEFPYYYYYILIIHTTELDQRLERERAITSMVTAVRYPFHVVVSLISFP